MAKLQWKGSVTGERIPRDAGDPNKEEKKKLADTEPVQSRSETPTFNFEETRIYRAGEVDVASIGPSGLGPPNCKC